MNSGQYLKARTRAYKTIALTAALAFDCEWALALERDCQFLAAEAITRQVLSLSDADKNLPEQLWSHSTEKDPLMGLSETELYKRAEFRNRKNQWRSAGSAGSGGGYKPGIRRL